MKGGLSTTLFLTLTTTGALRKIKQTSHHRFKLSLSSSRSHGCRRRYKIRHLLEQETFQMVAQGSRLPLRKANRATAHLGRKIFGGAGRRRAARTTAVVRMSGQWPACSADSGRCAARTAAATTRRAHPVQAGQGRRAMGTQRVRRPATSTGWRRFAAAPSAWP